VIVEEVVVEVAIEEVEGAVVVVVAVERDYELLISNLQKVCQKLIKKVRAYHSI